MKYCQNTLLYCKEYEPLPEHPPMLCEQDKSWLPEHSAVS
jgi:hypothetical protein